MMFNIPFEISVTLNIRNFGFFGGLSKYPNRTFFELILLFERRFSSSFSFEISGITNSNQRNVILQEKLKNIIVSYEFEKEKICN